MKYFFYFTYFLIKFVTIIIINNIIIIDIFYKIDIIIIYALESFQSIIYKIVT